MSTDYTQILSDRWQELGVQTSELMSNPIEWMAANVLASMFLLIIGVLFLISVYQMGKTYLLKKDLDEVDEENEHLHRKKKNDQDRLHDLMASLDSVLECKLEGDKRTNNDTEPLGFIVRRILPDVIANLWTIQNSIGELGERLLNRFNGLYDRMDRCTESIEAVQREMENMPDHTASIEALHGEIQELRTMVSGFVSHIGDDEHLMIVRSPRGTEYIVRPTDSTITEGCLRIVTLTWHFRSQMEKNEIDTALLKYDGLNDTEVEVGNGLGISVSRNISFVTTGTEGGIMAVAMIIRYDSTNSFSQNLVVGAGVDADTNMLRLVLNQIISAFATGEENVV